MDSKLAMKIYNVMCATEGLEKDTVVGKGTKGEYKAVGEAAVLNSIKPLLKKEKLSPIETTELLKISPTVQIKSLSNLERTHLENILINMVLLSQDQSTGAVIKNINEVDDLIKKLQIFNEVI